MVLRTCMTSLILFLLSILATPLLAQGASTNYLITWDPNPEPNILRYIIYRSLEVDNGFVAFDSVSAVTHSYIDTGLPMGTRFYYRIIAKNTSGDVSPPSNPVSGLTIPQNANEATKDLCRINNKNKVADGSYDVTWSTIDLTTGFLQYDTDLSLDLMSAWDNQLSTVHTVRIDDLRIPATYFVRAASYDNSNNMTVSAIDTLNVEGDEPLPPTAPLLSIYPVPYHPAIGGLTFANLPLDGSVTIFNENGLQIWMEDVGSESTIIWDGSNQQGIRVMSGVYYVIVKDSKGDVVEKRPIMVVN